MKHIAVPLAVSLLGLLLVPTAAGAHVPLGSGNNERLATATRVSDPTKSWAVYANLREGGEAQYYTFQSSKGQKIQFSLMTTTAAEDATFLPGVILMGPGIPNQGTLPSFVEIPPGAGHLAIDGKRASRATYEPFAPSAFMELANVALDAPEDGTYVIAVHAAERGGHYSLAIGTRESFTPAECLLTPTALLSVYVWERQGLPAIFGPALVVIALGLFMLRRRRRGRAGGRLDVIGRLGAAAGLLFIGTGATVATQMLLSISRSWMDPSAIVTLIFAALPALLGWLVVRHAVRASGRWTPRARLYLALLGLGGFAVWAGVVVGPVLAIVAALLPAGSAPAGTTMMANANA